MYVCGLGMQVALCLLCVWALIFFCGLKLYCILARNLYHLLLAGGVTPVSVCVCGCTAIFMGTSLSFRPSK